jgi:hypothetical protein
MLEMLTDKLMDKGVDVHAVDSFDHVVILRPFTDGRPDLIVGPTEGLRSMII